MGLLPRSRLYHLDLMGINSACIESLSSFLVRLAKAYNLPVQVLIGKIIQPVIFQQNPEMALTLLDMPMDFINGTDDWVIKLARVMEGLTGHDNLSALSLHGWGKFLPNESLLHPTRHWCPLCFAEWKRNDKPVYDPLIWYFKDVNFCLRHHVQLVAFCPYCHSHQFILEKNSRNGYCSKCFRWLGQRDYQSPPIEPEMLDQLEWYAETIGETIRQLTGASILPSKESICNSIRFIAETISPYQDFSRIAGMPQYEILYWLRGIYQPDFTGLLNISYCFKVPLPKLLFNTVSEQDIQLPGVLSYPVSVKKSTSILNSGITRLQFSEKQSRGHKGIY